MTALGFPKTENRPAYGIEITCRVCGKKKMYACTQEDYEMYFQSPAGACTEDPDRFILYGWEDTQCLATRICPTCREKM